MPDFRIVEGSGPNKEERDMQQRELQEQRALGPFGYLRWNTREWRDRLELVGKSDECAAHARAPNHGGGSRFETRFPAESIYAG
ncbi:hypothetical protein ACVIGA_006174 [Bradyrhizobium sp. USDA 3240]